MTITSEHARNAFTITSPSLTMVATSIQAVDLDTIRVKLIKDGIETELAYGVDFDLYKAPTGHVSVVFMSPPPVGATCVVWRDSPVTQGADFQPGRQLRGDTIEAAIDRIVLMVQELRDKVERSLRLDDTVPWDPYPQLELPLPDPGKILTAKANGWEHKTLAQLGGNDLLVPVSISQGGTGASTADAARANLGIGNLPLAWSAIQDFPHGTIVGRRSTSDSGSLYVGNLDSSGPSVGRVEFRAKNSLTFPVTFSEISGGFTNNYAGSEDGFLSFVLKRDGANVEEAVLGDGLVLGAAAGGPKGVGTINCTQLYINGAALTLPVFGGTAFIVFSNPDFSTAEAHGLGTQPSMVQAFIQCISAEHGYDIGDRVDFTNETSCSVWSTSSQVGITVNGSVKLRHKTSGVSVIADPTKWRMAFRWIRFYL